MQHLADRVPVITMVTVQHQHHRCHLQTLNASYQYFNCLSSPFPWYSQASHWRYV